jgi:hypothetical protein
VKTSEQAVSESKHRETEAVVGKHVEQLFKRLPMLSGFCLRPDLELDEVTVIIGPNCNGSAALCDEVLRSLLELAQEQPEAVHAMRGRTFARALH